MFEWLFGKRPNADDTPVSVAADGKDRRQIVSFLLPDEALRMGIPSDAIIAEIRVGQNMNDATVNPGFVAFLHRTIREAGPADSELRRAAARQGDGYVYIIDLRTPDGPQGRVPPADIIGGFQVIAGAISPDLYWANDQYNPIGPNGPMQLPEGLRAALVRALPAVGIGREVGRSGKA